MSVDHAVSEATLAHRGLVAGASEVRIDEITPRAGDEAEQRPSAQLVTRITEPRSHDRSASDVLGTSPQEPYEPAYPFRIPSRLFGPAVSAPSARC